MCAKYNLYTKGDTEEYTGMLNSIKEIEPTTNNIFVIANDICKHSQNQNVTDIMSTISNEVIRRYYLIYDDNWERIE